MSNSFAHWVRPLYLYAMCLVSLIVFIIGATTIGNELMRRYIFGLETSWYENPKTQCEYILTGDNLPKEGLVRRGDVYVEPISPVPEQESGDLSDEERQERYNRCIETRTEDIEQRSRYQLADKISTGTTMILVALPLFFFHWRIAKRERKTS